jgi:hypothetical protein
VTLNGEAGQVVRLQRRTSLSGAWADWRELVLTGGADEFVDEGTGEEACCFYRAVLPAAPVHGRIKRCRIANNLIGPCLGRGIWVNGDDNVVESNDVHRCRDGRLWEGLFVEGGSRNAVRQNRLIECLPLRDLGVATRARDNDHFAGEDSRAA